MTTFKDYLGSKDVRFWDGIARTFTRKTSTGGTLTNNKIGSVVDILEVYGSSNVYTDATLSNAISLIGSNPCTILFQPGTWTIANDVTIPSTMSIMLPQGAKLSVSTGKTLTISGNIIAGSYVIFDGAGTIGGSPILAFKDSYWFSGTVTDSTTPTYKTINLATASFNTDTISERTAAAGVTVDGVKLKDSEPYCDVINEKTAATGVTIDGVLLKDSKVTAQQITSNVAIGTAPLVVTSTTEVANLTPQQVGDGTNIIRTKIINIGDWDMDGGANVDVAHGLTLSKIRNVSALIRANADTAYYPVDHSNGLVSPDANIYCNATNVHMERKAGGFFDGVNFGGGSFNRGWITIIYVP